MCGSNARRWAPDGAVGIGVAGLAAEHAVGEIDQRIALGLVGHHLRQVMAGAAAPVLAEVVAVVDEPEGFAEFLDFAQIRSGGIHTRTRSNVWRAMVRDPEIGRVKDIVADGDEPGAVFVQSAGPGRPGGGELQQCQAKAVSDSPHTWTMASVPRGEASVAATMPGGSVLGADGERDLDGGGGLIAADGNADQHQAGPGGRLRLAGEDEQFAIGLGPSSAERSAAAAAVKSRWKVGRSTGSSGPVLPAGSRMNAAAALDKCASVESSRIR